MALMDKIPAFLQEKARRYLWLKTVHSIPA